ncbi:hypothetical protein FRB91_002883 [Serendipita sp. 411]|nr:hypothetical protein FRC18_005815 [Serendipita sp. 400]KAG8844076.1 hypothetical protein FRB91_002883 [Serendipita sp. 411]
MNTNTHNTAAPAKAPLSTRIESHIPGTEAHRERKFAEAQVSGTGFQGSNVAGAPTMNTAATVPGAATGYQNTAPTVAGSAPTTGTFNKHGNTMSERVDELHGRGTTVPKAHMGDKVMGSMEATLGRITNNPAREEAGLERKTFGDPKHYTTNTHGHGLNQQQGFGPTGQPAQQAFTHPQQGYAQQQQGFTQPQQGFTQPQQGFNHPQSAYPPPTTQPPTGY